MRARRGAPSLTCQARGLTLCTTRAHAGSANILSGVLALTPKDLEQGFSNPNVPTHHLGTLVNSDCVSLGLDGPETPFLRSYR